MPESVYEYETRQRKLLALSRHFRDRSISGEDVSKMHPDVRAHHAKLAGVRTPSDETWSQLATSLGKIEAEVDKFKDDPFAGL